MRGRVLLTIGLALASATSQAGAVSEPPPRQTYADRFSTSVPGAPTGRAYDIDWFNTDDPEAKPRAFSHLHVELAEGARFDTSAIPQCAASDPELMALGAEACPPGSRVATDETVIDTGVPGPNRYATVDIVFFNNQDELVLIATIRELGARVILRAQVGENTIDLDVPMLPGTPPDGGAATSQVGVWEARTGMQDGRQTSFLTTPPTCPKSGHWVNRATYTYRDGVTQTAESRSPCDQPDGEAPRIRAPEGIPSTCASDPFRARFRVIDDSRLRSARVRVGGRTLKRVERKRFSARIPVEGLTAGAHAIRVSATDAAGNRAQRSFRFRRCGG
ncbi:MAG TPA: hypothetical protein VD790_10655 [Thermoleophilaceae bacterium]|nr:hypothetical protein [Thermoleophilaceae bacterium]